MKSNSFLHTRVWRVILIAAVVTVLLATASLSTASVARPPAQSSAQDPPPGQETLLMIQQTILPPRDRIDLAQRLLGVTDIPEPPTVPPAEHQIGDVVAFWADNLDVDAEFQVNAELVYKTDHIYMFVEVGEPVDRAALQRSADTFEQMIRPRVHDVFGTEWFPGIDGDPHLYILHARNLGNWVAAYYGSSSQYPVEAVPTSNTAEMFFVNLDTMAWAIGTAYYESVLAHEFQHMVHWAVDSNEDTWLNEGLSELAAMITGYGASDFASSFLETPNIQLNSWPEDDNRGVHYGAAFMFVAYFYERYGEPATTTLVSDPANGMESVSNTLAAINAVDPATGEPVDHVDVFSDWLVANLLMDPAVGDGRYAYVFDAMSSLPPANITSQLGVTDEPQAADAPQWGAHYLRIPGGPDARTYRLSFKGLETVRIVPANAYSGRYMVWSNRGDDSDARLTRTFDLTGVSRATLNYWTWYHIEDLWDYGYIMVSVDGGATWTPLATSRTTTEDPHSNAYGPGYTGQSGGWVQESVDLSDYAGQEIQVRFEYITDDAVTQPGMIVDDISVPELDYFEDFESGMDGWVSEGWLRMDNVLPQYFSVQLVQPGNTAQPVLRLLDDGDTPQAEWEITAGGSYGDATLVVSGLAPVTTEPATYSIMLTVAP